MSSLNPNPFTAPHASPGPVPVLEGVTLSPPPRPAPFSQPYLSASDASSGTPSGPPAFDFQVRRSLRMHVRLALLVGFGVCLLLLALGFEQPRMYTASSVIYVEPLVARGLNEAGAPGFDQSHYSSFLDQQMQTIVRPDVLTAALRSLPAGTWRGKLESEESAVARLAKALTVERALSSYQVNVKLKASDPGAAASIVNAVTNAYLQRGREDEFKQADIREQILSEERERLKQELATDRKEQAALGASMGLASPADGAGNYYDVDLTNLRLQLAVARQARDVAAAQLETVTGQDPEHRSGLIASADDLLNTDPGLNAKKTAVNARRVLLESLMAGLTPSNPQYRQAQDEIADLDHALEARTADVRAQVELHIQDKLRTDLERTAEVESKINGQLAQAASKATGAGPRLQRAAELASDIQRLTARYSATDDALSALEIETSGPGRAHISLPAVAPLSPDANHGVLLLIAALPFGLVFGVCAAVIARMRDGLVYLGSDLQQATGFAPIAVLPAREDVSNCVVEEYVLRLAAGVESAYRTSGARSFVVTAVSTGTQTEALLADLARRLQDLRLQVHVVPASELLLRSRETMEHQAAKAASIATGELSHATQPGEGIASAKLDRLKGRFDIILIDADQVLHSAEAEYAARCADATILIAESAVTRSTELRAATALLSRLRVAGVGAVLDHVKLAMADEPFRNAVRIVEKRNARIVADSAPSPTLKPLEAAAPVPEQAAPIVALHPNSGTQAPAPVSECPVAPEYSVPVESASDLPHPAKRDLSSGTPAQRLSVEATPTALLPEKAAEPAAEPWRPLPGSASKLETAQLRAWLADAEEAVAQPDSLAGIGPLDDPAGVAGGPTAQVTRADDSDGMGHLVGATDTIEPVPLETRSKIRRAFGEQEVNAKTTWFSRLFRSDAPANVRIFPNEGTAEWEEPPQPQRDQVPVRLPESMADDDAGLSHLLSRIKTSGETRSALHARPTSVVAPEPPAPSGRPVPFVERRSEARAIESDEDRSPVVAAENVAVSPASSGLDLPVLTAPAASLVHEEIAIAVPEASSEVTALASGPSTHPLAELPAIAPLETILRERPLRPLTFQQLAGSIEADALHEGIDECAEAELPASSEALPNGAALQSGPARDEFGSAGGSPKISMSMWPGRAPMNSSYAQATRAPEVFAPREPVYSFAATASEGFDENLDATEFVREPLRTTAAMDRPIQPFASFPVSPSDRRSSMRRISTNSRPSGDPTPAQRPYRLGNASRSFERSAMHPLETQAEAQIPMGAAGTSFPPNLELRQQLFGRRESDGGGRDPELPGLTRRWKLLGQFEQVGNDPVPALRQDYMRSTERNLPRQNGEG